MQNLSHTNVLESYEKIKNYVKKTPVLTSSSLNQITNCQLYFKCENFQKVGAFKFRGALNAVLSLPKESLINGVATHSSGNHAQALSLSAKLNDTKAYIVMPKNSARPKIEAVKYYGAEIIFCEPTLASRESTLEEIVKLTNAVFIHPYNNLNVIAGQGTCALEFLQEVENLDYLLTPLGGGGLLSGTLLITSHLSPKTKVIGVEPAGADDAYRSLEAGYIIPSINPNTIADGLLTSLGTNTFEIIKKYVYKILRVTEEGIIKAMRLIWERMKIIVEPSSAVTLSAVMEYNEMFQGKKVGIILSGGNVDLDKLPWLAE